MPDPAKLANMLRLAREKTLATPGRTGHLIDLSDLDDLFVIGDLHGNVPNFQTLYKNLQLDKFPRRHLVLQELIHGPNRYPAGGDKSHQLVDLFAALKCQYPTRVHYLIGNHELAQMTGKPVVKHEEDLNCLFDDGVEQAYGSHAHEILACYKSLFEVSPLGIRLPNRIYLSHTLPHAKHLPQFSLDFLKQEQYQAVDLQAGGLVHSNLWGRDTTAENVTNYLTKVDCDWLVCGHIPCEEGFAFPCERQLVMDCAKLPGGYAHLDVKTTYDDISFRSISRLLL